MRQIVDAVIAAKNLDQGRGLTREEYRWLGQEAIQLQTKIMELPAGPTPRWVLMPRGQKSVEEIIDHMFEPNPNMALHLAYHFGELSALIKYIKEHS